MMTISALALRLCILVLLFGMSLFHAKVHELHITLGAGDIHMMMPSKELWAELSEMKNIPQNTIIPDVASEEDKGDTLEVESSELSVITPDSIVESLTEDPIDATSESLSESIEPLEILGLGILGGEIPSTSTPLVETTIEFDDIEQVEEIEDVEEDKEDNELEVYVETQSEIQSEMIPNVPNEEHSFAPEEPSFVSEDHSFISEEHTFVSGYDISSIISGVESNEMGDDEDIDQNNVNIDVQDDETVKQNDEIIEQNHDDSHENVHENEDNGSHKFVTYNEICPAESLENPLLGGVFLGMFLFSLIFFAIIYLRNVLTSFAVQAMKSILRNYSFQWNQIQAERSVTTSSSFSTSENSEKNSGRGVEREVKREECVRVLNSIDVDESARFESLNRINKSNNESINNSNKCNRGSKEVISALQTEDSSDQTHIPTEHSSGIPEENSIDVADIISVLKDEKEGRETKVSSEKENREEGDAKSMKRFMEYPYVRSLHNQIEVLTLEKKELEETVIEAEVKYQSLLKNIPDESEKIAENVLLEEQKNEISSLKLKLEILSETVIQHEEELKNKKMKNEKDFESHETEKRISTINYNQKLIEIQKVNVQNNLLQDEVNQLNNDKIGIIAATNQIRENTIRVNNEIRENEIRVNNEIRVKDEILDNESEERSLALSVMMSENERLVQLVATLEANKMILIAATNESSNDDSNIKFDNKSINNNNSSPIQHKNDNTAIVTTNNNYDTTYLESILPIHIDTPQHTRPAKTENTEIENTETENTENNTESENTEMRNTEITMKTDFSYEDNDVNDVTMSVMRKENSRLLKLVKVLEGRVEGRGEGRMEGKEEDRYESYDWRRESRGERGDMRGERGDYRWDMRDSRGDSIRGYSREGDMNCNRSLSGSFTSVVTDSSSSIYCRDCSSIGNDSKNEKNILCESCDNNEKNEKNEKNILCEKNEENGKNILTENNDEDPFGDNYLLKAMTNIKEKLAADLNSADSKLTIDLKLAIKGKKNAESNARLYRNECMDLKKEVFSVKKFLSEYKADTEMQKVQGESLSKLHEESAKQRNNLVAHLEIHNNSLLDQISTRENQIITYQNTIKSLNNRLDIAITPEQDAESEIEKLKVSIQKLENDRLSLRRELIQTPRKRMRTNEKDGGRTRDFSTSSTTTKESSSSSSGSKEHSSSSRESSSLSTFSSEAPLKRRTFRYDEEAWKPVDLFSYKTSDSLSTFTDSPSNSDVNSNSDSPTSNIDSPSNSTDGSVTTTIETSGSAIIVSPYKPGEVNRLTQELDSKIEELIEAKMANAHTSSLLDHANLRILTLNSQLKLYQSGSTGNNGDNGENNGVFMEENPLLRGNKMLKPHGKSEKTVVFAIDDRLLNMTNEAGDGPDKRRRSMTLGQSFSSSATDLLRRNTQIFKKIEKADLFNKKCPPSVSKLAWGEFN